MAVCFIDAIEWRDSLSKKFKNKTNKPFQVVNKSMRMLLSTYESHMTDSISFVSLFSYNISFILLHSMVKTVSEIEFVP